MKSRPILFSAPMVRAILDGRKMQTRRIVKPQPDAVEIHKYLSGPRKGKEWELMRCFAPPVRFKPCNSGWSVDCHGPFNLLGRPGDQLWVKETWGAPLDTCKPSEIPVGNPIIYRADYGNGGEFGCKLWPSIFMLEWMSRITLEIASIRVERLQDISDEDAWAEGIGEKGKPLAALFNVLLAFPKLNIGELALSLPRDFAYGDDPRIPSDREKITWVTAKGVYAALWESINGPGSWNSNPWVWVITFKKLP